MKSKVYIETSIISYLTSRTSNDLRLMANRDITIEWWENCRSKFDIYISEYVVAEASRGDPEAAARRMSVIAGIDDLVASESVKELTRLLMKKRSTSC